MAIDPNLASLIIISEKPRISEDVSGYDPSLLDMMVNNIGTLATIYVKPPELFVKKTKKVNLGEEEEADYEENAINLNETDVDSINEYVKKRENKKTNENIENSYLNTSHEANQTITSGVNLLDLNDILGGTSNNTSVNTNNLNTGLGVNTNTSVNMVNVFQSLTDSDNLIGNFNSISISSNKAAKIPHQIVLNENVPGYSNKLSGLMIEAAFQRAGNNIILELLFSNKTMNNIQVIYNNFKIKLNFYLNRISKFNSIEITSAWLQILQV